MPDREKVIERLKRVSYYFKSLLAVGWQGDADIYREHRESVNMALALLKEQEAVKWISVNERLPKSVINKVLVYLQHDDLASYIGFGHYEKYNGVELWYDLENNEQFSNREYTVTHWMPLPTPPEERR